MLLLCCCVVVTNWNVGGKLMIFLGAVLVCVLALVILIIPCLS